MTFLTYITIVTPPLFEKFKLSLIEVEQSFIVSYEFCLIVIPYFSKFSGRFRGNYVNKILHGGLPDIKIFCIFLLNPLYLLS